MSIHELIQRSLQQDIQNGDLVMDSFGLSPQSGRARLVASEDLVLAGTAPFAQLLATADKDCQLKWLFAEGDIILGGQTFCQIHADPQQLLKAKSAAVGLLGHLSGIATYTQVFASALEGTDSRVIDSVEALPGYRELEGAAVIAGGGRSHIEDFCKHLFVSQDHILAAGDFRLAVERVRMQCGDQPLAIEVTTAEQAKQASELRVDTVILNSDPGNQLSEQAIRELVSTLPQTSKTVVRCGASATEARKIADLGVDYISIGAITHSAPRADMALTIEWQQD